MQLFFLICALMTLLSTLLGVQGGRWLSPNWMALYHDRHHRRCGYPRSVLRDGFAHSDAQHRRRETARFLENKREWNARLNAKDL
jgi:hypothetical protein